MQTNEYAISVKSLCKSFQNVIVLNGVNFNVKKGSIFCLLGSNGAGKTTTIKILTTLTTPDSGNVNIEGLDILKDIHNIHEIISLTGQFTSLDESLTGLENMVLIGEFNHLSKPKETANKLLDYFDLSDSANRLVSTYSGGMKRKLDIAMSLVSNPSILFLDEPTTGLDPQSRHSMWKIIRELNNTGVTVFLTTQYLEEAEQLADRIAILDKGRIIAEGTSADLKKKLPHGMLEFTFSNTTSFQKAVSLLSDYKFVSISDDNKVTVYTDGAVNTVAQILNKFTLNNIKVEKFSQLLPTLEDVFLTIIDKGEDK